MTSIKVFTDLVDIWYERLIRKIDEQFGLSGILKRRADKAEFIPNIS